VTDEERDRVLDEALAAAARAGNEVWNRVSDDPQWGAAQAAAVQECRGAIDQAIRALKARAEGAAR